MKLSGIVLSIFLVAGCAATGTRPVEPWRVEVSTSGGIAGRGMGTYAVASDGNVTATLSAGRSCSFALTSAELRDIAALLRDARPSSWKPSYIPANPCCDRFEYNLTLDEAGAITETKWIDDPLPLPADLEALANALVSGEKSIRSRAGESCR